ncbi:hypothetical protein IFO70_11875 [Phormidium tenue FACHB-886]|nr:hypothetical protein [Phormidium tenue FACHB-886]
MMALHVPIEAPPTSTSAGLTGIEAFQAFLSTLQPKNGSTELWLKVGNDRFYTGDFNSSGRFQLWATKGTEQSRRRSHCVGDAFEFLDRESRKSDGGVLYIPTQPLGTPTACCVNSTDDIGIEMDGISTDAQLSKYQTFSQVTGLTFSSLITSGGKSIHGHLKTNVHSSLGKATYLRRLAILAFLSDPVTERPHQPMRSPGFFRTEKQREQVLLSYSSKRYTYKELIAGLSKWFAHQGWEFPDSMPDDWWRKCFYTNLKNSSKLSESDKAEIVRANLAEGLKGWQRKQEEVKAERQRREAERKVEAGEGEQLSDRVRSVLDQLGSAVFGENTSEKTRLCCPFHDSQSGNSAWIAPPKGETKKGWSFHCSACTADSPIDGFLYWYSLRRGGGIQSYPRGKEYAVSAKQFLREHGVDVPDSEGWKQKNHSKGFEQPSPTDDRTDEQRKRDRDNSRRRLQFQQYLPNLSHDFELTETSKRKIEWYEGHCPKFRLTNRTLLLQGWIAAGKTESIINSLMGCNKPILWLAPRNGLLRDTATRLGVQCYHYQDNPTLYRQKIESGEFGIYMMAPDSFKTYSVGSADWANWVVVIDEFSSVRKEILRKTASVSEWRRCVAECAHLIVADAFLSNADCKILRRLRRGDRRILAQVHQKSSKKIHWVETRTKDGKTAHTHNGVALALVDRWIKERKNTLGEKHPPYLIASDSLLDLKVLQRYVEVHGLKFQIVCSETPEQNRGFLPDPDQSIKAEGADFVGITPTVESGVNIQHPFKSGLLIARGVLSPTRLLQIMGRGRQCQEWFVSAPRRQNESSLSFKALSAESLASASGKLKQAFQDFDFESDEATLGWGLWDEATGEIERTFGSEYLHYLLEKHFESPETNEISAHFDEDGNRTENFAELEKVLRQDIRRADAERTLQANVARGFDLLDNQKAPALNAEVWDVKLAEATRKLPKTVTALKKDYIEAWKQERTAQSEIDLVKGGRAIAKELMGTVVIVPEGVKIPDSLRAAAKDLSAAQDKIEQAIETFKVVSGGRIEKLKTWLESEEFSDQDFAEFQKSLTGKFTSARSGHWRKLRAITLYRELKLASLAQLKSKNKGELIADTNAFWAESDTIKALYDQFLASPRLRQMFPLVDGLKGFFAVIKSVMRALGFQSYAGNKRVKVDTPAPNGKDRKDRQRFSKTASSYLIGWLIQECSGNEVFQCIFPKIKEELHEQIVADCLRRQPAGGQPDTGQTDTGQEAVAA